MIADKLYNDPELHWVVLLMNDITDRYHQWPLTENQFLAHINDKYDNVDATHHYEISQTSGDTTIKIDIGTDNSDHAAYRPEVRGIQGDLWVQYILEDMSGNINREPISPVFDFPPIRFIAIARVS